MPATGAFLRPPCGSRGRLPIGSEGFTFSASWGGPESSAWWRWSTPFAASRASPPVFGVVELRRVLAFAEFAHEVLMLMVPLEIEVRVEGWKAYCLVPPSATIVRRVSEWSHGALLWVHDEAWAAARFRDGGADLVGC